MKTDGARSAPEAPFGAALGERYASGMPAPLPLSSSEPSSPRRALRARSLVTRTALRGGRAWLALAGVTAALGAVAFACGSDDPGGGAACEGAACDAGGGVDGAAPTDGAIPGAEPVNVDETPAA